MSLFTIGTPGDDTLDAADHQLVLGLAGNDTITAREVDLVLAGSGNDDVTVVSPSTPGNVLGDDVFVFGGPGDDMVNKQFISPVNTVHVTAFGGPGDDHFRSVDFAFGGPGDDTFDGSIAGDFTGGPGHDTFFARFIGTFRLGTGGGTIEDFTPDDRIVLGNTNADTVQI